MARHGLRAVVQHSGNVVATAALVNPLGYVAAPGGQFLLLDANNSEAVLRGP